MAVFGPVQVIPPGFLSLLNLKNKGVNPDNVDSTVGVTVELRDWLLEATSERSGTYSTPAFASGVTGYHGVVSGAANLIVPSNEYWWVEQLTVWCDLGAGDTIAFAPCWIVPAAASNQFVLPHDTMGPVVGPNKRLAMTAQGFWLPSDARVGVQVQEVVAAVTVTCNAQMRFTRLRI